MNCNFWHIADFWDEFSTWYIEAHLCTLTYIFDVEDFVCLAAEREEQSRCNAYKTPFQSGRVDNPG